MAATETTLGDASSVRRINLPIALKFFLGSAFLIALAVAAAVIVTYLKGEQIARRAVETSLTTSSEVQKEFEQNRLDQLQLKVQLIAADPSTSKYVAQAGGPTSALPGLAEASERDTQSIADLLKERQSQFAFDLGIVLDAKGNVLGRSDQTEAFTESLADDPFIKPALAKASPFSGYWRVGNKLYQAAIMPLQQDQTLIGFLLVAQSINNDLCQKVAKLSGAQIAFWLPAEQGLQLVASSLDEASAKALQETLATQPSDALAAIRAGKSIPRVPLAFAGQNWVAKLAPTAEGESSLGSVLVLTSTDRIIASYRDILNWVLIGGAVSIAVALLLSYLLAKGILRPVRAMAQAAEQAAAGNYRTQIGLGGSDELARLSRAFDSLLSDLREKSDIEGYVGNLSRFLPEPSAETVQVATAKTTPTRIEPARREPLVLLGLEFRQLAKVDANESADSAQARYAEVLAVVENAARAAQGLLRGLSGPRFVIALDSRRGIGAALRVLAELHAWARTRSAPLPAAALVSGDVVAVAGERQQRVYEAWLGAQMIQIDRLLGEAAVGQTLLARQTGDELKQQLGEASLGAGVGSVSGKRFYALSDSALKDLPTQTAGTQEPAPAGEGATVIATQRSSDSRTPVRSGSTRGVALEKGSVFGGRYQILSELGSGGMGVVYKAHDLELDDVVALKMLKPAALVDAEQLDRLKSEIKLARRITHPNVLRTFDFGEVDGYPYISMEYVRGLTLRYLLNETKRIPYSAGLRIARQLCAGLAAAHEVGVLHRDIKPENLILEQNGNAKLMDFGIARPIRRTAPGHTQQGMFLGTPNYSAPEQLSGEDIDERADIYASGVLMCEMFCGRLPYSGSNTMEIYLAQMQQAPIKPSDYWAEIPPPLEVLILRCLAKRPSERYQSALELAQALSQLRA